MKRPSIDEVLASDFCKSAPDKVPELLDWQKVLKEAVTDFIKRDNVYKFDGKEKFD